MNISSALLFASGAVVIAHLLHDHWPRSPITTFDGAYKLPWYTRFDFSFRLPTASEDAAKKCASLVVLPDVRCDWARTPNGQRWLVTWQCRRRGAGDWYALLCQQILRAAAECGEQNPMLLATCQRPGIPAGLGLATPGFQAAAETESDPDTPSAS